MSTRKSLRLDTQNWICDNRITPWPAPLRSRGIFIPLFSYNKKVTLVNSGGGSYVRKVHIDRIT